MWYGCLTDDSYTGYHRLASYRSKNLCLATCLLIVSTNIAIRVQGAMKWWVTAELSNFQSEMVYKEAHLILLSNCHKHA